MGLSADHREELLRHARELARSREYSALVLSLAPLARQDLLTEPQLAYLLADAWQRTGQRDSALQLLRDLGPVLARRGNDPLYRRRLNLEGTVLFGLGRMGEAERVWRELLDVASRAGDTDLAARSNNNLGVVHTLRGDREAALVSYGRAIAAYQQTGYLRGLAQAHHNEAIIYREMDFLDEAEHHFGRAMDYAMVADSKDEIPRIRQERALLACYRGDLRLAAATGRHALLAWERLGDPVGAGDTHRILGVIAWASGQWDKAAEEAEQSLVLTRRAKATLIEAEVLTLQGLLAGAAGDRKSAGELQARADELFTSMGAEIWGHQLRFRLTRLAQRD